MREPRKLCFDGADDFGMAVPGIEHADAAGEIDVALAFHVPDLGVLGARRKYLRHHADAARGRLRLAVLPLLIEIQSFHDAASLGSNARCVLFYIIAFSKTITARCVGTRRGNGLR